MLFIYANYNAHQTDIYIYIANTIYMRHHKKYVLFKCESFSQKRKMFIRPEHLGSDDVY